MKDVMIDLETMGIDSSAAIVALGACTFDEKGLGPTFYKAISLKSNDLYKRTIDGDTVVWWLKQDETARKEIYDSNDDLTLYDLKTVLEQFRTFFLDQEIKYVWGNGSDFDNVILANAFKTVMLYSPPWLYRNNRCFRTLRNTLPIDETTIPKPLGIPHNALYDAMYQAQIASEIFKRYNLFKLQSIDM